MLSLHRSTNSSNSSLHLPRQGSTFNSHKNEQPLEASGDTISFDDHTARLQHEDQKTLPSSPEQSIHETIRSNASRKIHEVLERNLALNIPSWSTAKNVDAANLAAMLTAIDSYEDVDTSEALQAISKHCVGLEKIPPKELLRIHRHLLSLNEKDKARIKSGGKKSLGLAEFDRSYNAQINKLVNSWKGKVRKAGSELKAKVTGKKINPSLANVVEYDSGEDTKKSVSLIRKLSLDCTNLKKTNYSHSAMNEFSRHINQINNDSLRSKMSKSLYDTLDALHSDSNTPSNVMYEILIQALPKRFDRADVSLNEHRDRVETLLGIIASPQISPVAKTYATNVLIGLAEDRTFSGGWATQNARYHHILEEFSPTEHTITAPIVGPIIKILEHNLESMDEAQTLTVMRNSVISGSGANFESTTRKGAAS